VLPNVLVSDNYSELYATKQPLDDPGHFTNGKDAFVILFKRIKCVSSLKC